MVHLIYFALLLVCITFSTSGMDLQLVHETAKLTLAQHNEAPIPSWFPSLSASELKHQMVRAVETGSMERLRALISLGAPLDIIIAPSMIRAPDKCLAFIEYSSTTPDLYLFTPSTRFNHEKTIGLLDLAVLYGHKGMIPLLMSHGLTLDGTLKYCAFHKDVETAATLLSLGAPLRNAPEYAFRICNELLFTFLQKQPGPEKPPFRQELLGTPPLQWAAANGQCDTVRHLLEGGTRCSMQELKCAVMRGQTETVALLLNTAQLDTIERDKLCWVAIALGYESLFELFYSLGFNIHSKLRDDTAHTILYENDGTVAPYYHFYGALHIAARFGQVGMLKRLRALGAESFEASYPETALFQAVKHDKHDAACLLLADKPFMIGMLKKTDFNYFLGALCELAIQNGYTDLIAPLLVAINELPKNDNPTTADHLLLAAAYDYTGIIAILLDSGRAVDTSTTPQNLFFYEKSKRRKTVSRFLNQNSGWQIACTPLFVAVMLGNENACRMLLSIPFFSVLRDNLIKRKAKARLEVTTFFLLFNRLKTMNIPVPARDVLYKILGYDQERVLNLLSLLFQPDPSQDKPLPLLSGLTAKVMSVVSRKPKAVESWGMSTVQRELFLVTTVHAELKKLLLRTLIDHAVELNKQRLLALRNSTHFQNWIKGTELDPALHTLLDADRFEENFEVCIDEKIRF